MPQNRYTDNRIATIIKRAGIGKAKRITVNNSRASYYRYDAYWDKKRADLNIEKAAEEEQRQQEKQQQEQQQQRHEF